MEYSVKEKKDGSFDVVDEDGNAVANYPSKAQAEEVYGLSGSDSKDSSR